MALTVGTLYKKSAAYKMSLVAGQSGLANVVEWVHIIETVQGAGFLHGHELVITEGILGADPGELLAFVKVVYHKEASGLILNTGKYLLDIPGEVLDFCNEHQFPLFTIPWEIPLVDVTKFYYKTIFEQETHNDSLITIFKNLLFGIGEPDAQIRQMVRMGIPSQASFQILCISTDLARDTDQCIRVMDRVSMICRRTAARIHDQFLAFHYQEDQVVVLVDYSPQERQQFLSELVKKFSMEKILGHIFMGISDEVRGLRQQSQNFKKAFSACGIARKKKENILYYDDLGLYKLLVNVSDPQVTEEFYRETFGRIEDYDRENGTKLLEFLEVYIRCNGSPGEVSECCFIHRNTVNNYVKRIEKILGLDLMSWEGRAKLYVAYTMKQLEG